MSQRGSRTSDVLAQIADSCGDGQISMRDFTTMMGNRTFALVILVFSLPNSLPVPGTVSYTHLTLPTKA